jgi:hypothetical protein
MEQVCKVAWNDVWAGTHSQPISERRSFGPFAVRGPRTLGVAALTVLLWVSEGLSSSRVAGDSRFGDVRPKMVAVKCLDRQQVRGRGQSIVAREI